MSAEFPPDAERALRRSVRRARMIGLIAGFIAVGGVVLAYVSVLQGAARRDQSCRGDEREHLEHVRELRNTYDALGSRAIRRELGPAVIRFTIMQRLPELEEAARTDQAPDYCDADGVGLEEPDPRPPKLRDFSHLLSPADRRQLLREQAGRTEGGGRSPGSDPRSPRSPSPPPQGDGDNQGDRPPPVSGPPGPQGPQGPPGPAAPAAPPPPSSGEPSPGPLQQVVDELLDSAGDVLDSLLP